MTGPVPGGANLPYDLALIPCTKRKNPESSGRDMSAAQLYGVSQRFAVMMRHACQRAPRIVIMSALHGLISPETPIRYYDAYLPELSEPELRALRKRVEAQSALLPDGVRVLSYLSNTYHAFLAEVAARKKWNVRRPHAGLDMFAQSKVLHLEVAFSGRLPDRRGARS